MTYHAEYPSNSLPQLHQLMEDIVDHYKTNPSHGAGCACMDGKVRILRNSLRVTEYWSHEEPEHIQKAVSAIDGMLSRLGRDLHHYQKSKCTCSDETIRYGVEPPNPNCLVHGIRAQQDWG